MALFVYITEECLSDARKHNCEKYLESFKEKVLKDQRTTYFDQYPPPYLKKRFEKQQRLIAGEYSFGENTIVCFFRILIRGGREYNDFKADPVSYGNKYFEPIRERNDLNSWLEKQLVEDPPPEKKKPSPEEEAFLWEIYSQESSIPNEKLIFESQEWIVAIQDEKIKRRLVNLPGLLIDILENSSDYDFPKIDQNGFKLLGRYFKSYNKLFLCGISIDSQEGFAEIESRYSELLHNEESEIKNENILKSSRRSYPDLILYDEDRWIEIEENKEANLALSPEESDILESVQNLYKIEKNTGFPLFINGGAGSGKSTVLQYIFSDYLRFALENNQEITPPLYLTYSNDLLQKSKNTITNLIRVGVKSIANDISFSADEFSLSAEKSFYVFKDFLLKYLVQDEELQLFHTDKNINYRNFKKLWGKKFSRDARAQKINFDLSWHIIRSYIKGYSLDGFLEPEEYAIIPEKEKNVSQESYELVYQKVWENWYKELTEVNNNQDREHWDDQDLVKYLIDKDRINPIYPAVFCDESQDFTRIELELLLRLCLFSERKINSTYLNRVPFAFAGDPFQTLNPTGFRWESIKASFTSKFIHSLDPALRFGDNELNYQELKSNYRSTKNVTKFCNLIQALRTRLFNYRDIGPQYTWLHEKSSPMPVWFDVNTARVEQELKNLKDIQVIVPCSEGEEAEYVQNNEMLKRCLSISEDEIPKNVLSPQRAKGLEFNRVILFGFGDYAKTKFSKQVIDILDINISEEERLAFEYFINRLYVGVSRPKRRLFIVDTREGLEYLWRFATDLNIKDKIITELPNNLFQNEDVVCLQQGRDDSFSDDQEDPREVAKNYETEGKANKDPYLIYQAAMAYESIDEDLKAFELKGLAASLNEDYKKAGNLYEKANQWKDAIKMYWRASEYDEIKRLGEKYPEVTRLPEVRVSTFISSSDNISLIQFRKILEQVGSYLSENRRDIEKVYWENGINAASSKLIHKSSNLKDKNENIINIISNIENIIEIGYNLNKDLVAILNYEAGFYSKALELWNELEIQPEGRYELAQVNFLTEKDTSSLSQGELQFLGDHFLKSQDLSKATQFYEHSNYEHGIYQVIELKLKNKDYKNLQSILLSLIDITFENESLNLGKISEIFSIGKVEGKIYKDLIKFIHKDLEKYISLIIEGLARSSILPKLENTEKSKVSALLNAYFANSNLSKWAKHLHPLVIGSAFERAGKDIDSLAYYEQLLKFRGLTSEEKRSATKRWIYVKLQQASREGRSSRQEIKNQSIKHQNEAESKMKLIGIDKPLQEPKFPDLSIYLKLQKETNSIELGIETEEKKFQDTHAGIRKFKLGGIIDCKVSPQLNRLNMEHGETLQTVVINIEQNKGKSDDVQIEEKGEWLEIKEWAIAINVTRIPVTKTILIKRENDILKVPID